MISEHECFRHPQNKDISIWRYMDFAKLVSLLQTRSLFFTRASQLLEQDPLVLRNLRYQTPPCINHYYQAINIPITRSRGELRPPIRGALLND